MRIVFLDVDGPLIPGRMYFREGATYSLKKKLYRYCPSIVDMVNYLTDTTGAQVVFNSSHNRRGADTMVAQAVFNKLRNVRKEAPITCFPMPFGNRLEDRIEAVKAYVSEHGVERFCYFDDENLRMKTGFQQVDFHEGISVSHVSWAIDHLMGKKGRGLGFVPGMINCKAGLDAYEQIRRGENPIDIVQAFIV